ncbi:hypothetical protein [Blastococcus sp. SYSU DS0619]
MRKKIVVGAAAGALTLTGLAVAVPALAAPAATAEAAAGATDRIRDALSGLVSDGSLTQEQADQVAGTLAEQGLGGRGGHPGGGWLDLSAAAGALGLTEEELRTALEPDGTTLADVAEDQGVAAEDLVDALVLAEEERIAEAVEEGRLTQEQADERLADVETRVTERIESTHLGRGGRGDRGDDASRSSAQSTESTEETPAD